MVHLMDELVDQPRALRELARHYRDNAGLLDFPVQSAAAGWTFTGMGASFHAAWIGATIFRSFGLKATAVETVDLFNYAQPAASRDEWTVYISQSGSSGEVGPFLDWFPREGNLAAITNHPQSELGERAGRLLPMQAGEETLIAAKTYLNTLGILWLLARRAAGRWSGDEFDTLQAIASRAEAVYSRSGQIREQFETFYDLDKPLVFLGHGPHAATARMAAMGMSEWAKVPALNAGIGAFRHGFIESVHPGHRVVVFAPEGRTKSSAVWLAEELKGYGARVLLIENGCVRELDQPGAMGGVDEMLSPILDILPVQIAADGLARSLGIEHGFRFISKVVRQT